MKMYGFFEINLSYIRLMNIIKTLEKIILRQCKVLYILYILKSMETAKAKIRRRRNRYDYREYILKATITDGKYEKYGYNIDYRSDYAEFLKEKGLLVYACNWYPEGDPRVMWYIQGTPEQINIAINKGKGFNRTKKNGQKNFFTFSTKKYDEVYLAKIPYDPNYSTCDFTTFMATLPETYGKTEH